MNRTMIAIALVAVAAVLPWPTAQGFQVPTCVTDALARAEGTATGLIGPYAQSSASAPCARDLSCQQVISTVGVKAFDPAALCDPTVATCPAGQVGVTDGDASLCVSTKEQVGLCDDGNLGAQVAGWDICEPAPGNPCADRTIDCSVPVGDLPGAKTSGTDPHCVKTNNDNWGLGGSQVSCQYACRKDDVLTIKVDAKDTDATVSGDSKCGGAEASCSEPAPTCAEPSKGVVGYDAKDATCAGRSYEKWDSPVTVECYAIGPSLVCQVAKICNDSLESGGVSFADSCSEQARSSEWLAAILSEAPAATHSFAVFKFDATAIDYWTGEQVQSAEGTYLACFHTIVSLQ